MTDGTNVTPTFITLGEAAKRTGLSKATISRMIKSGKISVHGKGEDGAYRIDPTEIVRFMDAARVQRVTVSKAREETNLTPSNATLLHPATALEIDNVRLAERVKALEGIREQMQARIDHLGLQCDRWQEQAQRLALAAPITQQSERRGLFGWLRKAG